MVAIVNRWQVKTHLGNLALQITRQRCSEYLFRDDGPHYFHVGSGESSAIIGRNFVLGTVRS